MLLSPQRSVCLCCRRELFICVAAENCLFVSPQRTVCLCRRRELFVCVAAENCLFVSPQRTVCLCCRRELFVCEVRLTASLRNFSVCPNVKFLPTPSGIPDEFSQTWDCLYTFAPPLSVEKMSKGYIDSLAFGR